MEGIVNFVETYFIPVATKIGNQRHLLAIRDGVVFTIPLTLVGSAFLIIAFPPIPALAKMAEPLIGNILIPMAGTFNIIGLLGSFLIAYALANSYKVDPIAGGILGLSSFCIAIPWKDGLPGAWIGARGFFVAMIVSLIAAEIHRTMVQKNIVIKMPDGVPPTVARSFAALIPAAVVITLVWIVALAAQAGGSTIPGIIDKIITAPLLGLGGTLPATMLAIFAAQLLWCFGIHGMALVGGIIGPVWFTFTTANAEAKAAGLPLPSIFTQQFIDVFVLIGGSGTTLALALILFAFVKSEQLKAVGRTAIWPGLFNINEPITFGLPIVMNPIMMIPFILAPMSAIIITYLAMSAGIVEKTFTAIPWTSPVLFSGFLATGDFKASILQIVNFAVAGAIYYPFIMAYDKMKVKEEQEADKA